MLNLQLSRLGRECVKEDLNNMAAPQTDAPRAKPGWMSMPGGPKQPNFSDFQSKMQALGQQKSKLFEQLKDIQVRAGASKEDAARDAVDAERRELRNRMNEIDAVRKAQREAQSAKNEQIAKTRKQKQEVEQKLKELSTELGAFRELSDVDAAIDHIMIKMETGASGTLAAEKRALKRLNQLEEAKSLIMQLQPLAEAISVAEDKEAELQREYRAIHERIGTLNREFEEKATAKSEKDKELRKSGVDRSALQKEREDVRANLTKVSAEMTALRESFNKQVAAWDAWKEEARAKYQAKIEAERAERALRFKMRQDAAKYERKKARAAARLNPREAEIHACQTLIRYLQDRVTMMRRDEEERKRRQAASTFDPASCAPPGTVFAANDAVPATKRPSSGKAGKAASPQATLDKKVIQHSEEKIKLFALVKVDSPMTVGNVPEAVEQLRAKQKEFEALIKTGTAELSSSSDEEAEEDAQPEGEATAVAAASSE
jgi:hypothetical protein